jgi:hypothetical protein
MGIAWLLLKRTFTSRPKRTVLFLLGYALATAVMITLLAVGQAVLLQAQDKNLLGGGDLILVPQGIDIESMKVGGITALYYSIPQARFVVRQLLGSSRFEKDLSRVSPYVFSRLLYARQSNSVTTLFADGSLPDQEAAVKHISLPWENSEADNAWLNPPAPQFYDDIDHFHLPTVNSPLLDRWAEWHYFTFESDTFHGYLSIMVAGNVMKPQANWIVSLQMIDRSYNRYSVTLPADTSKLPLQKIDYSAGESEIRFINDHYELSLHFKDRFEISGRLLFYPQPGLYFPPSYLAHSDTFESGYVIPALRGQYQGAIQIGNKRYDFTKVTGYHDHNWGIWQKTEWNWGHLFSPDYSIFYGEIFLNEKSKGLFLGVFDKKGFLSIFRPQRILFSNYAPGPTGSRVPMQLEMKDSKRFSSINVRGRANSFIPSPAESSYFIQYNMDYSVQLEIDGKPAAFEAKGNAETYVRKP